MRDELAIKLKYTGNDVDDGTMSVEDMIPALQGFASAYGKIVNSDELQVKHKLRVVGVNKGSFDILLQIATDTINNAQAHGDLIVKGTLGYFVIDKIIGTIKITKHVKNQAFDTTINGNGTITVINAEKMSLEVPYEIFELFKSKILQSDIGKIVKPLEEGKIDSTEIEVIDDGKKLSEKINVEEKKYFDTEPIVITKTDFTILTGYFLSLYKTTNNGYFVLNDGTRVTYHFAGEKPESLWSHVIHKGPVKVKCIVHLDENLKPALIDIYEVEILQPPFDFGEK